MNIAKIEDLKVNLTKKLNNETKKNLVKIIEEEFVGQSTQYNHQLEQHKEKIMDKYRKQVKFDKLVENLNKANFAIKQAKEAIENIGLQENGQIIYNTYNNERAITARDRLNKLLDAVAMSKPQTYKNKIISRLWMSDNMGEAMVILREVLGNGVIPTLDKNQLALAYKEE